LATDYREDTCVSEESVDGFGVSNLVSTPKLELLPSKEISSGALQNPTAPDVAYSGHKGQGNHVQIAETYTPTEKQSGDVPLNLITYVEEEKGKAPNSDAFIPAVDDLEPRDMKLKAFFVGHGLIRRRKLRIGRFKRD
jgi:hypothetical protein